MKVRASEESQKIRAIIKDCKKVRNSQANLSAKLEGQTRRFKTEMKDAKYMVNELQKIDKQRRKLIN